MRRGLVLGCLATVASTLGTVTAAPAGTVTVEQQNKAFTPSAVSAKVGDTLVFTNGDLYTHNMFSVTSGHEFNLGGQNPGENKPLALTRAGTLEVECQIHPRMHLTVTVK